VNLAVDAILSRCSVCQALVDAEDLFCANCGTEVADNRAQPRAHPLSIRARNFQCRGCGAAMNYDARAQSLKCPFCGSLDLVEGPGEGILAPEFVLPFTFDRAEAENRLRAWLGSSFWHPNDLRGTAQVAELRSVYIPFWVFATRVSTHWTADTDQVPWGARASWYPLAGHRSAEYVDLWVPAGAGLAPHETEALFPFDLGSAVPPDQVNLTDVTVEQFSVSRRYARPMALQRLEALEAAAVAAEVPGGQRHVHVNCLMEATTSRSGLVPVYILAYRYKNQVYRFVINGQTGQATGTSPTSLAKVGGVIGLVVVAILIVVLLILLFR
jgi:predicted RNA-binding Zn-ribbon protein involved in translation (DUF1610 family)